MTAHIIAACRSAVAPRGGAFATTEPHMLAVPVIAQALSHAGLDVEQVDEVIVSNALGMGGNLARITALACGLPKRVAGLSIDRQCAGGMDAILLARDMITSGGADVVIAGGAESYSRRPLRLRTFADGRDPERYDQAPFTPWPDRDPDMAKAADLLGKSHQISREDQDAWAVESHAKAQRNIPLSGDIVPVKGLKHDPFTRTLSLDLCRRAQPIAGDITAANTAVAADASAFCIVVSERLARASGLPTLRIIGGMTVGGDPTCPGLAPVAAVTETMSRAGLNPADLSVVEVMEAYAVQVIACVQGTGIDPAIVNTGGGALARGHPIGASGAINTVRLAHELWRSGGSGLATIAAAGGIGTALLLGA